MTTFPHSDSELTFAAIDSHVRAQSATATSATSASTQGNAWQRLVVRYSAIRPVLAALSAIPLIPPTWRAGLAAFIATADEVAVLTAAPVTTLPAPVPVTQPDFKAGKDQ
jgi:hypothetical protein